MFWNTLQTMKHFTLMKCVVILFQKTHLNIVQACSIFKYRHIVRVTFSSEFFHSLYRHLNFWCNCTSVNFPKRSIPLLFYPHHHISYFLPLKGVPSVLKVRMRWWLILALNVLAMKFYLQNKDAIHKNVNI